MTDSIEASVGVRAARTAGTVRIVGAGLLGASIGHALRGLGVDVALADASPAQLRLAVDYGASSVRVIGFSQMTWIPRCMANIAIS